MSTYSTSKYKIARNEYVCLDCDATIPNGTEHLAFQIGQRHTSRICVPCSVKRGASGAPLWYCAATLARCGVVP
jgi:hypothetical protein